MVQIVGSSGHEPKQLPFARDLSARSSSVSTLVPSPPRSPSSSVFVEVIWISPLSQICLTPHTGIQDLSVSLFLCIPFAPIWLNFTRGSNLGENVAALFSEMLRSLASAQDQPVRLVHCTKHAAASDSPIYRDTSPPVHLVAGAVAFRISSV
jgi:hypothetical protein